MMGLFDDILHLLGSKISIGFEMFYKDLTSPIQHRPIVKAR